MTNPDPYRAFRFLVELDAITEGGVQMVSGIERSTEFETYREGGRNDFELQFAIQTTFPPLVLTRGLYSTDLWDWHQRVIDGDIERQTVTIVLRDEADTTDLCRWICQGAIPSKWTGADLDAVGGLIATETVELVHHGITRG